MNSDTTEGSWRDSIFDSDCTYPVDWHGPRVAGEPERKPCIRIVALKQGFVVSLSDYEDDDLAFTDAFDIAEWLLEWLGLELPGFEELRDFEYDAEFDRVLGVAKAAQAYVELNEAAAAQHSGFVKGTPEYNRLREAVKKWRA